MRNKGFYSSLWYDVIRPEALKADNYMCRSCKARHHSVGYRGAEGVWIECDSFMIEWCKLKGIKVRTMFLQVSNRDHNTYNNSPTNLQALCPRCHLRFDKDLRIAKRIMR